MSEVDQSPGNQGRVGSTRSGTSRLGVVVALAALSLILFSLAVLMAVGEIGYYRTNGCFFPESVFDCDSGSLWALRAVVLSELLLVIPAVVFAWMAFRLLRPIEPDEGVSLDAKDHGRMDSPKIAGSVAATVSLASGVLLWLGGGVLLASTWNPESGIRPLLSFFVLVPSVAIISAWVALRALIRESPPHQANRRWSVAFMAAMFGLLLGLAGLVLLLAAAGSSL